MSRLLPPRGPTRTSSALATWVQLPGYCTTSASILLQFQRKLRGAATRVDHSTAGAQVAEQLYPGIGRLIAFAVAGHHAGLANGAGETTRRTSLQSRLADREIKAFDAWRSEIEMPGQCTPPRLQRFHPSGQVALGRTGFRAELPDQDAVFLPRRRRLHRHRALL